MMSSDPWPGPVVYGAAATQLVPDLRPMTAALERMAAALETLTPTHLERLIDAVTTDDSDLLEDGVPDPLDSVSGPDGRLLTREEKTAEATVVPGVEQPAPPAPPFAGGLSDEDLEQVAHVAYVLSWDNFRADVDQSFRDLVMQLHAEVLYHRSHAAPPFAGGLSLEQRAALGLLQVEAHKQGNSTERCHVGVFLMPETWRHVEDALCARTSALTGEQRTCWKP